MKVPLLTPEDIIAATGGWVTRAGAGPVCGVAVDSRRVQPGDLFVALRGARVDGHSYVHEAWQRGASWALVGAGWIPPASSAAGGIVEVADTWRALGQLAAYHRNRYRLPVVGVTGSIGKTSTKDLIGCVLSRRFQVLQNRGNENSDIGLPLTLFRLHAGHEVAVLEMAMRGLGQIAYLAEIARPCVGVLTHIDSTHLEVLGSLAAIAQAKAELLDALPVSGMAILNWDSAWVRQVAPHAACPVMTFGLQSGVDISAQDLRSQGARGTHCLLTTPVGNYPLALPLPGRHMVQNALAAVAVGLHLGLTLPEIAGGLEQATISQMRAELSRAHGLLIINDAYNAHPQSMLAALELLEEVEGERKVAVLGSMLELGEETRRGHRLVGRAVGTGGVDRLIAVGEFANELADAAIESGLAPAAAVVVGDNAEAMVWLNRWLIEGDAVLVKGSRGLGMDEIASWLTGGGWRGSS